MIISVIVVFLVFLFIILLILFIFSALCGVVFLLLGIQLGFVIVFTVIAIAALLPACSARFAIFFLSARVLLSAASAASTAPFMTLIEGQATCFLSRNCSGDFVGNILNGGGNFVGSSRKKS
jgi:hypothetical protein